MAAKKANPQYATYKLSLSLQSDWWIKWLRKNVGVSAGSTVDTALLLYKQLFNMREKMPTEIYLYHVRENIEAVAEEIINHITSKSMSAEEMKKYFCDTLFENLTTKVWKKSEIERRHRMAQRIKIKP